VMRPTESSSPCTLCLCKVLDKLVDAPNKIIKPFPKYVREGTKQAH
jgi:hypothetical protein